MFLFYELKLEEVSFECVQWLIKDGDWWMRAVEVGDKIGM